MFLHDRCCDQQCFGYDFRAGARKTGTRFWPAHEPLPRPVPSPEAPGESHLRFLAFAHAQFSDWSGLWRRRLHGLPSVLRSPTTWAFFDCNPTPAPAPFAGPGKAHEGEGSASNFGWTAPLVPPPPKKPWSFDRRQQTEDGHLLHKTLLEQHAQSTVLYYHVRSMHTVSPACQSPNVHPVVSSYCRDTRTKKNPCLSVCVALCGIQLRVAAAQISIGLRDLQLATSLALASVSLACPLEGKRR